MKAPRRLKARLRALGVLLCVLSATAIPLALLADDPSDWPAIERRCRASLRAPNLTPDARAELTAELATSLAQQANGDPDPESSQRRWTEADQLLANFLKEHPGHVRAPLLHRQRLIYAYTRGEALRQQADLVPEPALLSQARVQLQTAEALGVDLEARIQKQLDAYTTKKPGEVPFEQLVALSNDTPFRLAQVRLSLAQTHAANSPERQRLLEEAAKSFAGYARDGFREDELLIRAQLGLAMCRRLQGDYAAASRALAPLDAAKSLPPRFQEELLARKMDLLIAQQQPQAARGLLKGRTKLSGDVALLNIHALLLEARQALSKADRGTAARLQVEALEQITIGEREYPAGWGARATGLLGRHGLSELPADDLKLAERLAESFHRAERWTDAAAAYDRAARLASAANDPGQAFDLAFKSAGALARADKHQEAATAFQQVSKAAPSPERAAQASLLAAHAYRRRWEATRTPDALAQLRQAVAEHLQRHGGDATAGDAYFLAGLVAVADSHHGDAIRAFAKVPADHRLAPLAVQETAQAYRQQRSVAEADEAERLTREALAYLDRHEKALTSSSPTAALPSALLLARAQLLVRPTGTPGEFKQAQDLLQKVLANSQITTTQRESAREALVLALAGMSAAEQAERLLQRDLSSQALHRLRKEVRHWMDSSAPAKRRELAVVQLAVVRKLGMEGASVDLQREEAACLVLLARSEEARQLFTALDRTLGRDPGFIQTYAAALQQFATADDLSQAADLWRRLERLSTPGSETWLEAKYQLAGTLAKLGEKERALKVLRVTSELWLKDPTADIQPPVREKNRQRFIELEREIGR